MRIAEKRNVSAFKVTSRYWHNALLAAASLGVALVVCEVGLRLLLPQRHPYTADGTSSGAVVYSEFQRTPLNIYVPGRRPAGSRRVRPNPSIFHGLSPEITFTVDQFGFRGSRPVTLVKSPGAEPDKVAFVTASPCVMCAKLMVQAKVSHLFFRNAYRDPAGLDVLRRAGVVTVRYTRWQDTWR